MSPRHTTTMLTVAHRWTTHRKYLYTESESALLELTHRWPGCTHDADQPNPAQTPLRGRHHGGTRPSAVQHR